MNMNDRSNAINAFVLDAKRFSQTSDFVKEAQSKMEERLKEILKSHGKEVEIHYTAPRPMLP